MERAPADGKAGLRMNVVKKPCPQSGFAIRGLHYLATSSSVTGCPNALMQED
jgi:hypothetical protein